MKNNLTLVIILISIVNCFGQTIADFENFGLNQNEFLNGSNNETTFESGHISLGIEYDSNYDFWNGWAISSMTDVTTPGPLNQYSCIAGSGYNQSSTYAVAYFIQPTNLVLTSMAHGGVAEGMYINNSTYTYLSMKNGDNYAKKFGGITGDDEDFYYLSIKKYEEGMLHQDSINFYLADFRFADNSEDYIVDEWTYVDLTSLGNVDSIQITLHSSDVGVWGINTPTYFCIDNFETRDLPTSVEKINDRAISIYPNPVKENLYLTHDLNGSIQYEIISQEGKRLKAGTLQNDRIDINELPAGMYVLKLEGDTHIATQQFLKV